MPTLTTGQSATVTLNLDDIITLQPNNGETRYESPVGVLVGSYSYAKSFGPTTTPVTVKVTATTGTCFYQTGSVSTRQPAYFANSSATDLVEQDGTPATLESGAVALTSSLAASTGSSLIGFIQSGAGVVARTVQDKGRDTVSVKDFGAKGDGVKDDTAAFTNALATGKNVSVPAGTYKISAPLTVANVFLSGESANVSHINYTGVGTCITITAGEKGAGVERLDLESQAAGQSGIYAAGAVGIVVRSIYLNKFDQYQLRVGNVAAGTGCYWCRFSDIRMRLDDATNGLCGLFVDGGTIPSSNNNLFDNITIGGNYQHPLWLKGNANQFRGGDLNWTRGAENILALMTIEGGGNVVLLPYVESADTTVPATVCNFTAASVGNQVEIWPVFAVPNMSSAVSDAGMSNRYTHLRRGQNFSLGMPNTAGQNLVVNSAFSIWRDANHPQGWGAGTARISKDTVNVRGGVASLMMTEAASHSSIQHYFNDYFTSTYGGPAYPLAYLGGRDVVAGVWCKTAIAGAGNIQLWTQGIGGFGYGGERHTGSGNWELLLAHGRVPAAVTRMWIELRSHVTNTDQTGDITFSEPFLVFGQEPVVAMRRALPDTGGTVYGDVSLYSVGTVPADSGMLWLGGSWLWVDPSSGKLRIKTGTRPADLAADGVVVGTQT